MLGPAADGESAPGEPVTGNDRVRRRAGFRIWPSARRAMARRIAAAELQGRAYERLLNQAWQMVMKTGARVYG
jgi:hypothetical protein